MAWFKKKDKDDKKAAKEELKAAEQPASTIPSLRNVKAESAAAPAEKKPTAKKAAAPKAEKAPVKDTKAAPKATPAKAATKTATAKAAPAKTATKAAPSPVSVPRTSTPLRPFFVATEEDIRLAFDEAIAQADKQILKNGDKAVGKYEFALEVDGFHFYLIANNGQVLFESPSFTTLIGALNGLKTFKKTVAEDPFDIRVDKYNRYRFILARKYYGENYTTKEQCTKCVESVKNFANNARVIRQGL